MFLVKRQKSRRRVAALAFLSNISLDGTHSDTNLAIFNRDNRLSASESKNESAELQNAEVNVIVNHSALIQANNEDHNVVSVAFHTDEELFDDHNPFSVFPESSESTSQTRSLKSLIRNKSPRIVRRTSISGETREQFLRHRKNFENISLRGFDSTESISGRSHKRSGSTSDSSSSAVGFDPKMIKVTPNDNIKDERVVLVSSNNNVPFMIYSYLPFYSGHKKAWMRDVKADGLGIGRKRHVSSGQTRPLTTISDGADPFDILGLHKLEEEEEISYEQLLVPSRAYHPKKFREQISSQSAVDHGGVNLHPHHHHQNQAVLFNRCISYDPTAERFSPPLLNDKCAELEDLPFYQHHNVVGNIMYTPHLLDDPELVAGKHRTLLTFTSYVTSVMDYVRPADLKKELNDKFKERFPHIQLTLTKLRSLKKEMKKITMIDGSIDLLTVSQCYVYFEKLILKGYINKHNRKCCAGACMILAAKLNDIKGAELKNHIEKSETVFRLSRKELLDAEFPVLVALEFSLHVPTWEIFPHYQRLLYG